jgi:hypothetical protein
MGIMSKSGRYGGTFAHKDCANEIAAEKERNHAAEIKGHIFCIELA